MDGIAVISSVQSGSTGVSDPHLPFTEGGMMS